MLWLRAKRKPEENQPFCWSPGVSGTVQIQKVLVCQRIKVATRPRSRLPISTSRAGEAGRRKFQSCKNYNYLLFLSHSLSLFLLFVFLVLCFVSFSFFFFFSVSFSSLSLDRSLFCLFLCLSFFSSLSRIYLSLLLSLLLP